jgi:hypothetical protein
LVSLISSYAIGEACNPRIEKLAQTTRWNALLTWVNPCGPDRALSSGFQISRYRRDHDVNSHAEIAAIRRRSKPFSSDGIR